MNSLNASTILLAEDEPNDAFLLKHAFDAAGITNALYHVNDGQLAIAYISGTDVFSNRATYPLPCLAIVDLKMPRMGGLELLRWIRRESNLHHLVVIIFSSSFIESDIDAAYELGANSFAVKSTSLAENIEFASALKSYWLRFNRVSAWCPKAR